MRLTKAEQNRLHSSKCDITEEVASLGRGPELRYLVGMSLTRGEMLTLETALAASPDTAVTRDLRAYISNALERSMISLRRF